MAKKYKKNSTPREKKKEKTSTDITLVEEAKVVSKFKKEVKQTKAPKKSQKAEKIEVATENTSPKKTGKHLNPVLSWSIFGSVLGVFFIVLISLIIWYFNII